MKRVEIYQFWAKSSILYDVGISPGCVVFIDVGVLLRICDLSETKTFHELLYSFVSDGWKFGLDFVIFPLKNWKISRCPVPCSCGGLPRQPVSSCDYFQNHPTALSGYIFSSMLLWTSSDCMIVLWPWWIQWFCLYGNNKDLCAAMRKLVERSENWTWVADVS